MPPGTPPLELRFDEAGKFEYGTNRQRLDGQLTEMFVFFANSKDLETGWFVNRMSGDLFYVGRVPAQSKQLLKMLIGHCRSIGDRQF